MFSNENKKSDSEDNFILVTRPVRGSIKTSALFNLIEDLISEKNSLLSEYKIEYIEKKEDKENNIKERQAYLIKLINKPTELLFQEEGYEFEERHLTIDKLYSNSSEGNFGFRPHYTEQYINTESKQKTIVHVYFDLQGEVSSIQVKEKTSRDEDVPVIVNNFLKKSILNNFRKAQEIFNQLRKEKSNRYIEAKNQATIFESDLNQICFDLDAELHVEKYKKMSEDFVKQINIINRYNDSQFDPRAEKVSSWLKNMRSNIKKIENSKKVEENEKSENVLDEQRLPIIVSIKNGKEKEKLEKKKNKQQEKNEQNKQWLAQLKTLEDKLDLLNPNKKIDLDATIKLLDVSEQLKSILINLVLMDGFSSREERQKVVGRVETKIALLPKSAELLEKYFFDGEANNFIKLYDFFQDKFDGKTCLKFLEFLFVNKATKNHVQILDFLYEKSDLYRAVMMVYGTGFPLHGNSTEAIANMLVQLCGQQKLNLFKMFFRHGCNVFSESIYFSEKTFFLVKSLALLSDNPDYIEAALFYGASLDQKGGVRPDNQTAFAFPSVLNPTNLKNTKKVNINKSNIALPEELKKGLEMFHKIKWDIAFACKIKHYNLISVLAPVSDLQGLAFAIAIIMDLSFVATRLIPHSKVPGVMFVRQEQVATLTSGFFQDPTLKEQACFSGFTNALSPEIFLNYKRKTQGQVTFLIYANEQQPKNFTEMMLVLFDSFSEKIRKSTPEIVERGINELLELADGEKDLKNKKLYYSAVINIIVDIGPLSCNAVKKIIELTYKIAVADSLESDNVHQFASLVHFFQVFLLSTESFYFAELTKDKLFLNTCEQIQKKCSALSKVAEHQAGCKLMWNAVCKYKEKVSSNTMSAEKSNIVSLKSEEQKTLIFSKEKQSALELDIKTESKVDSSKEENEEKNKQKKKNKK